MILRLSRPEAVTMCSSVQTWDWSVVTSVGVGKYCDSGQLGTHQMSCFWQSLDIINVSQGFILLWRQ